MTRSRAVGPEEVGQSAQRQWPTLRRAFLYPPLRDLTWEAQSGTLPGVLTGHEIRLDTTFVQRMSLLGAISADQVVAAATARMLNRFLRIPSDFGEALRMYAGIRETATDPDLARRLLDVYLTIWNDLDLALHRGMHAVLIRLYRASAQQAQGDGTKDFWQVAAGVIQRKLEVDLGLRHNLFYETVVEQLGGLRFLGGADHVAEAREFGAVLVAAGFTLQETPAQPTESPTLWPVETDPFLHATDIAAAVAGLGDFPDALLFLDELTRTGSLGQSPLVRSRWRFYDHLSRALNLVVHPRVLPSRKGRAYPVSLRGWQPDDGFGSLAPLQSRGRIGIPGITKRWLDVGPESQYHEPCYPTLIVIIDSSGSMVNADQAVSKAALTAVSAASTYLDLGQEVGVYNFSSNDLVVGPTRDRARVLQHVCAFQSGGTTFSVATLEDLLNRANGQLMDVLLITDLGIFNAQETYRLLAQCASLHRVFLVTAGGTEQDLAQARAALGPRVASFSLNTAAEGREDIARIVLGAVRDSLDSLGKEEP